MILLTLQLTKVINIPRVASKNLFNALSVNHSNPRCSLNYSFFIDIKDIQSYV